MTMDNADSVMGDFYQDKPSLNTNTVIKRSKSSMTEYIELKPVPSKGTRPIRSQTSYPQKPHILGAKVDSLGVSSVAKSIPEGRYTYVNRILDESGEVIAEPGDTWWKIYEMSDREVTGWVAELYKGVRYLTAKRVTDPNPDTHSLPDVPYTIQLGDGVIYERHTFIGTLKPK